MINKGKKRAIKKLKKVLRDLSKLEKEYEKLTGEIKLSVHGRSDQSKGGQ